MHGTVHLRREGVAIEIEEPRPRERRVAPRRGFLEATIFEIAGRRLSVLVGLLILQSSSQIVLQRFEKLISSNIIIPLFLTMLVGAGGNAGNQAAVAAITGILSGELSGPGALLKTLKREAVVALSCGVALAAIGFVRVYIFYSNEETKPTPVLLTVSAVTLSLFLIVVSSVLLGATLPFLLLTMGLNIEHAAPAIQVVMDILGVTICCVVCSFFLENDSIDDNAATVKLG
jgi:Mg/Co/Ni transporter MgtE